MSESETHPSDTLHIVHVIFGRCGRERANGVSKSVYNFATNQVKLGCTVRLVCVTKKPVEPIEDVEVCQVRPPVCSLVGDSLLESEITRAGPDLIHIHSAYVPINVAVSRIARNNGIPYVVTPHGNLAASLLKRRPYLKYPYKFLFERPLLRKALFIHTIADSKDIQEYGVDVPQVKAVNGIDCPDDYLPDPDLAGLSAVGAPAGKVTFLFLGRLDIQQKGLDRLIESFALVHKAEPNVHLILAGSDWDGSRKVLEKMCESLAVKDAVTFTGPVFGQKKHGLLRDCDFFVHPSRWEAGIPFSVLEALSYGKRVLVTEHVDREGQLRANDLATMSEVSQESIFSGLLQMASLKEVDLGQGRERARNFLKEKFSWKVSTEKLLQGYRMHLS